MTNFVLHIAIIPNIILLFGIFIINIVSILFGIVVIGLAILKIYDLYKNVKTNIDLTNFKTELINSENRYQQLCNSITDYIYTVIIHPDNTIKTHHTDGCLLITGYSPEEFSKTDSLWYDIIFDQDRDKVIQFINNLSNNSANNVIEHRIIRKDGAIRWVSNTIIINNNSTEKLNSYDGIIRDITEQKKAEEALLNQNLLLNTIMDNIPIGIFMIQEADNKPLLANEQAKKLLGEGIITNDKLKINPTYKIGTNTLFTEDEFPINRIVNGNYRTIYDLEVELPDGERKIIEIIGSPVCDTNKTVCSHLITINDTTSRKNSEIAMRESEQKLSILFEYSQIGISLSDDEGQIQYMNPTFCQLLDYSPEEIIRNDFHLFTSADDKEREKVLFEKLRTGEMKTLNMQRCYQKRSKEVVWLQLQVTCFRDYKGNIKNFIAVAEDITEKKMADEVIIANEEKFRNIFNASNDAILITSFEGEIYEVNQIAYERTGFTYEQFQNINVVDIIAPNDRNTAKQQLITMSQNHSTMIQTDYVNKKNERIYIEINGRSIMYNGQPAALLISRDITERKLLQQKIMSAIIEAEEKERSHFAQELHDGLGPILSTVKLYLQWIENPDAKSNKSELITDALSTLEESINTVKEISNKLSPNILAKYGFETAIQSFLKKITNTGNLQYDITFNIATRLQHDIETMLYRVFVEAINNTIKYASATKVTIHVTHQNNLLTAVYTDNGKGFNVEEKINQKMGNGLFNMQNRVETYNGTCQITSSPNNGINITISIPLSDITIQELNN